MVKKRLSYFFLSLLILTGLVLPTFNSHLYAQAPEDCGLTCATGTLTSAQIKSLKTTPILAIPAPGPGQAIQLISSTAVLNYGGTDPFTNGQAIAFTWGSSSDFISLPILRASQVNSSSDQVMFSSGLSQYGNLTSFEDVPLYINNLGASEITGNKI